MGHTAAFNSSHDILTSTTQVQYGILGSRPAACLLLWAHRTLVNQESAATVPSGSFLDAPLSGKLRFAVKVLWCMTCEGWILQLEYVNTNELNILMKRKSPVAFSAHIQQPNFHCS